MQQPYESAGTRRRDAPAPDGPGPDGRAPDGRDPASRDSAVPAGPGPKTSPEGAPRDPVTAGPHRPSGAGPDAAPGPRTQEGSGHGAHDGAGHGGHEGSEHGVRGGSGHGGHEGSGHGGHGSEDGAHGGSGLREAVPAARVPGGYGEAARVLVVDDDPTVSEVVSGYLDRAGYLVDRAADGPSALARAAAHRPDLVVLDLMLPGMDGLEVCRRMRGHGPVPVIMLTARGDEDDRILGLEVGADDYVTKPFSPRELVLRVESVLRRSRPAPVARPLATAGLAVDPAARRATKHGEELALTIREFDLLAFFLRHPGRAYSREDLMREVWGWDFGDLSTVTVHVRRLRGKVEDDPASPRLIQTVWGVGYRFDGTPREEAVRP